jgi:pimeloyl-ACP methyl ester carboxylesterase
VSSLKLRATFAADNTASISNATMAGAGYDRPALVVWAARDRVVPPDHGRRLAELLPNARLVEIADRYTLIPLDQPAALAQAIRDFARSAGAGTASAVAHEDRGRLVDVDPRP